MIDRTATRAWRLAVGAPLERGVRQHFEQAKGDGSEHCHALASVALVQLTLKFEGQISGREQADALGCAELSLKFTLPNWVVAQPKAPG